MQRVKKTVRQSISALLVAVMLLFLCPVPSVSAENTASDADQVLEAFGWSDAKWGGLEPTITCESDNIKLSVTDTKTEDGWRATAIQRELSNINGVSTVTMQYSGNADNLGFSAQLAGNDSNGTWQQYSADGSYDNGTVIFSVFKVDGSTEAADLSTYSPSRLVIQIGSNNTLPSEMVLSDITIKAPTTEEPGDDDSGYSVKLTLSEPNRTIGSGNSDSVFTLADKESVFNYKMITSGGKFRLTFSNAVNGDVELVYQDAGWGGWKTVTKTASGTTVDFTYDDLTASWGSDLSALAHIKVQNNSGASITVAKVEWLGNTEFTPLPGETQYTVVLSATEGGSDSKNDETANFTRAAFKVGGANPGSASVTVDSGTKITVLGSVWLNGTVGDYLDSVKVNGVEQSITKGKDFEFTVNSNMSIVADYSYLQEAPKGETMSDKVAVVGTPISTLESGSTYQWYRVVGNATQNGTAISGATSKSYTPTENDKGCWLYCVIDGNIAAGPAAVVVSKTSKTTSVFSGSKSVTGGSSTNDTTDLWTPSSTGFTFNKAMIVPGGSFRMKCDPVSTDVKLVLKEPWREITGRVDGECLVFDYDALLAGWAQNFGNVGEIDVKNTAGSGTVTITSLEWTGYDIGVEETPYLPTDRLPFGGDAWELGWQKGTVTEDEEDNQVTANVEYDYGEWSVARLQTHSDTGFIVDDGVDTVSLDVYIEKDAMDAGKGEMLLSIVDCSGETKLNTSDGENIVTINGSEFYRTTLNIKVSSFPERFHDFILAIRGKNTNFNGKILVENITLRKYEQKSETLVDNSVELTGSSDTKSTTVTVSTNQPKVYGDDTIEVTISLSAKPDAPVTIKTRLNGDEKTDAFKDIPADDFKQAAQSRTVMAAYSAGETWEATAEIPVPCVVNEVNTVQVDVIGAPSGSTVTLTKLAINHTPPKAVSDSSGGGGGGGGGGGSSQDAVSLPHTWDFKTGLHGWKYEPGWNSDYSGASGTSARTQDGRMLVNVDYSKDGDKSWSQMAVTLWHNDGMAIQYATHASLDLYYLPENLDGSLALKLYSGGAGIDTEGTVRWSEAETVKIDGIEYKKVRVDFDFSPIAAETVNDMALCLIGRNTTYKGPLLIGNLTIEEAFAGSFVTSKHQVKKDNSTLRMSNGTLNTASGEKIKLPDQVVLVDGKASDSVRSVYAYLQAIGSSKDVLFGQQYNFGQKAGSANLSDSDTYDVVGDYSAVYGLDALALAGNEFSASHCNQLYGTPFPSTAEGSVVAAAYLTNTAIKRGAIVTLSCHMPNFSQVGTITPNCSASYARYDFSGYTPNVLTGDTANEILPGGKYNDVFNAYLDMIADYANRVDGAVLFRPFHENTGSWFWWGKAFCDAETYKNIYRYTVEYLRDEKGVHNFLYVYGPGSEAESLADYAERYPGDSYVDMVGFDMYNSDPDVNSSWMSTFKRELDLVSQFAAEHGKLVAVTETGAANATVEGDSQTALLRTGNKDKDWFNRVLDIVSDSPASYLLVWANFGQTNGFYTPYVIRTEGRSLYGHEMMDNFIDYYNDARSIFAGDQKRALEYAPAVAARAVNEGAEGYITSPVSGRRILNATEFTARVTNGSGAAVQFILHGNGKDVTLTAKSSDGVYYSAQLSKEDLESLGSWAGGSAELLVNGAHQQTIKLIFNIAEPVLDENIADDFDTYYGVDSLLNKVWTTNSGTGCSMIAYLDQTSRYNGDASLKLDYSLSNGGYAGVSRSRETDWSGCDALRFWTIPDGKGQKMVVQIVANGQVYEAYLNEYTEYKNAKGPILVTIPFAEFVQRDTSGQPKGGLVSDCKKVSEIGLWVNAIEVSGTMSGVLWYDSIAAVNSGSSQATFVQVGSGSFRDVPAGAWYADAVAYVFANEIMSGVGGGLFDPNSPMTRAMMVQVLYNMGGRPETDSQGAFQDVPDGKWYSPAVSWAVSEKIALGYSDAEFGPEDKVTREQMTVMLYNYAKLKQYDVSADADLSAFTDISDISSWALEAVRWANGTGLLNGMGDNTLAPGRSATRAQLASILMRFCEKIA